MEEKIILIEQIIKDTDRDMDRLVSSWDELRVEAYEKIREVLGYTDYIPIQKKDT